MMETYTNLQRCKVCGNASLTEVLRISPQYLSPTFVKTNSGNPLSTVKVPLTLVLCDRQKTPGSCGLLQLKEMVHADLLYHAYYYRSAVSETMQRDLREVVNAVLQYVDLRPGEYVLDIGCNDCTMLAFFPSSAKRVGIDPAKNIDRSHVDPSITVTVDYFAKGPVRMMTKGQKVKIVTCTAMFYDLPDPNAFVADLKEILAPDGIWCVQLSYLLLMIQNMNFYDICHEHLSYYSLETLQQLLGRHGLTIIDATTNGVNGGSLRVFVTHAENAPLRKNEQRLAALRNAEQEIDLFAPTTYAEFHRKIRSLIDKVNAYIAAQHRAGKLVLGLGASTKGNVLLQLLGITRETLPYISEKNPEKVGLRTLGTDIELISEEKARQLKPAAMLVLPWYFKEEIVKRERAYLEAGGTLLFPMSHAHLVTKNGEINL